MKKNITQDQIDMIISLSKQGYTNAQIATETELKHSTMIYWKKKLRSQGIEVLALLGRPTKKTRPVMKIANQTVP